MQASYELENTTHLHSGDSLVQCRDLTKGPTVPEAIFSFATKLFYYGNEWFQTSFGRGMGKLGGEVEAAELTEDEAE